MAMQSISQRSDVVAGALPAGTLPVKVGTFQQGVSVQATCGVFLGLAWITVLMRLYTRGILVRNIGMDDVWILLAVVGLLLMLTESN
jgi:hypothetical protein